MPCSQDRSRNPAGIDDAERFFIDGLLCDISHFGLYQTVPQRAQSALFQVDYLDSSLAEAGSPSSALISPRWVLNLFAPGGCPRRLR